MDWAAFAKSLRGSVVRPGDTRYAVAKQLYNTRFDPLRPAAIVYCQSVGDVQRSVDFAQSNGIAIIPRGGGHSYAGYSSGSGMVCDVSRMTAINVDGRAGTAAIEAGGRLIDIYAALARDGLALPGGSCPTVGISGLTLGGGVGVIGRKFGLTSDNLTALQIVTADGSLLSCDAGQNQDLFWACRGGGGGNFGIATSFIFRLHQVSELTLFTYRWPWAAAADVVGAWQSWAPDAPDELWSNCHLLPSSGTTPTVSVSGAYVGAASGLSPLLQRLRTAVGSAPSSASVGSHSLLDAMLIEAGCSGMTVPQCHLPSQSPAGMLERETYAAKSDFFDRPLSAAGVAALLRGVEQREASAVLAGGGVALDAFGGAFNRVPATATAFVHRSSLFGAQYVASWSARASEGVAQANLSWLRSFYAAMRPYAGRYSYQNYIDPDLQDWQHAYYGENLPRLMQVKRRYDPGNLFHFAQSIPPA